jgi:hypothetical protein
MSADQHRSDDALDEAGSPGPVTGEAATADDAGAEGVREGDGASDAGGTGTGGDDAEPVAAAGAGSPDGETLGAGDGGDEADDEAADDEAAGDDAGEPARRPRAAWRTPVFAVTRAVVVAAVATAGYLLVVPQTHTEPNRLSQLVVPETGLAAFPGKPPQSQSEPVGTSGIKSLAAAAKAHPDRTGIWVSQWAGTGNAASDGAAVVVFEAPTAADATKAVADLRPQTVDAKTTNQSFTKSASYTASGVPGSEGTLYTNNAAKAGQPSRLASILWQQGRVVGLVEEVADAGTQQQAQSLAQREAALLRAKEPGFTEKVTTYPTVATIVWWAVAGVVLVLVTGGPILIGRRRRRREAERQAMLDAQVRGHSAIAKRRRPVASPGGRVR